MSEAVAHEIGAHCLIHCVAADDSFEGSKECRGFAVGYAAVGVRVAELKRPPGYGIEVRLGDVLQALGFIVAAICIGAV